MKRVRSLVGQSTHDFATQYITRVGVIALFAGQLNTAVTVKQAARASYSNW